MHGDISVCSLYACCYGRVLTWLRSICLKAILVAEHFLFAFPVPFVDLDVWYLQLASQLSDLSLGPVCTLLELVLEEGIVLLAHSGLTTLLRNCLAFWRHLLRKHVSHTTALGATAVFHGHRLFQGSYTINR